MLYCSERDLCRSRISCFSAAYFAQRVRYRLKDCAERMESRWWSDPIASVVSVSPPVVIVNGDGVDDGDGPVGVIIDDDVFADNTVDE